MLALALWVIFSLRWANDVPEKIYNTTGIYPELILSQGKKSRINFNNHHSWKPSLHTDLQSRLTFLLSPGNAELSSFKHHDVNMSSILEILESYKTVRAGDESIPVDTRVKSLGR